MIVLGLFGAKVLSQRHKLVLEKYGTSLTDDPEKAELTHQLTLLALVINIQVEQSGHYLSHLIFRIKSLILSCGQGGYGLAPK